MAELFEPFALPICIEEREPDIDYCWQSKFAQDAEFRDIAAGPARLILQLASTVRVPQHPDQGPEPAWNEAVVDLVGDDKTIGIIGRQLRYLVAAIEEIVLSDLPEEQIVESVWRLHRAAYFG